MSKSNTAAAARTNVKKTYTCGICENEPSQVSHHKAHLTTEKHKQKKEIFFLQLQQLSEEELIEKYDTSNLLDIVTEKETLLYAGPDAKVTATPRSVSKKRKQQEPQPVNPPQSGGGGGGGGEGVGGGVFMVTTTDEEDTPILDEDSIPVEKKMKELPFGMMERAQQEISASNREALKEEIHETHNYLRNNGAGYGMTALKMFNLILGLRKIEEHGIALKFNLRAECMFSHLLQLAEQGKDEELNGLLLNTVLDEIHESPLRELLFYEIPRNIKANVISGLVKRVNKIALIEHTCNVQLSGKVYEYFIGRDETAISELGAYFTNRLIVEYILEKLDPTIGIDGTIGTMVDMFGGSGGFTTGYINHLLQKYPGQINWETEIHKVFHFDMNEDVIKSAALEFLCLTGVLPNMQTNMGYRNSFTNNFDIPGSVNDGASDTHMRYKYVLTNPPYGGDKKKKSDAIIKLEKKQQYIKKELLTITDEGTRTRRQIQLKNEERELRERKADKDKNKVCLETSSSRINSFAKKHNLKGNDKEACSLILIMDTVEEGGTGIGVLKEGVFVNIVYKELRRFLVENFNVREIISVPQDQFENTKTKTSIVIFDNTEEKTSQIVFRKLVVDKCEDDCFGEINGQIVLLESKDDIRGLYDEVTSIATIEDLRNNEICSLDANDYRPQTITAGEGYQLEPVCNLGDIQVGTLISEGQRGEGNVPVYGGGDISSYTHSPNRPADTLVVSKQGVSKKCVRLVNTDFYLSPNGVSLQWKDPNLKTYLNHFFLTSKMQETIYQTINGSVQKQLNMKRFREIKIPVPTSLEKTQWWTEQLLIPYNAKLEAQLQFQELEKRIEERVRYISEHEECEEVEFGTIATFEKKTHFNASEGKRSGMYRFYSSSQGKVLFRDEYEFAEKHLLIGNGGSASLHLASYFSVSNHVHVIKTSVPIDYVYHYLKINISLLQDFFKGSTLKNVRKESIEALKIKLPKDVLCYTDLIRMVEDYDLLERTIQQFEKTYSKTIEDLIAEAYSN